MLAVYFGIWNEALVAYCCPEVKIDGSIQQKTCWARGTGVVTSGVYRLSASLKSCENALHLGEFPFGVVVSALDYGA